MIRVDDFLNRVPGPNYECFDFAREVWLESFGEDVGDQLAVLVSEIKKLVPSEYRRIQKLNGPVDPCFVVMQRHRTVPHIGIFHQGQVLHLFGTGAMFDSFRNATRRYRKVTYYR